MDRIRVMLADDNPNVVRLLTDFLSRKGEIELVAAVTDGAAIVDTVCECAPDVLIMDIIMPRRDGFMVLEELSRREGVKKPKVIVLTGLGRDDFVIRALRLGASYYMVKPFDMQSLYARILDFARDDEPLPEPEPQAESPDDQITNLFLTLGIPAHIKGYQYLREAVRMVLSNHDLINRITKELYPGVARKFATSPSKVERAMRHAIEVAWTRGRLDTVNQLYGYKVFRKEEKPTNGEFISCIVEKIAMKKSV